VTERPFSQGPTLVVAHRGFSAAEAENTLLAFEAALTAGAGGVELDVRVTADGIPVVMHDPGVERTTDGSGLVREKALVDLKRLRIVTSDGGSTDVPTLAEVLRLLSGRALIDVEIKNIPGEPDFDADAEPAVEATIAALEETGFVGSVLVSSFNPASVARCRACAPDLATGLLTVDDVDAPVALAFARSERHPWVLPSVSAVSRAGDAFLRDAREAGIRVGTWVVDDPEQAALLARWGVDAIATNDPATIVPAVAAASR
jgi:glycerophosphoryl diester phosphodiesterase